MIDIHAHILPNLDDGPRSMETSVGMGRLAAQDGTTVIISTSHSEEVAAEGYEAIKARLDAVRAAWQEAGVDITLELGVEIFLRPDTAADLQAGRLWTLAGSKYALVELPYQPWPPYAEEALFSLQLAGYWPILAHPERYTAIQDDPNRLYALCSRGILSQVTASALLGGQGNRIRHCAEVLVRHNLVQFIASDAHGVDRRRPLMRDGLHAAEALIGIEAARVLAQDNPAKVLSNTLLVPAPEQVTGRKWHLGEFFRSG